MVIPTHEQDGYGLGERRLFYTLNFKEVIWD